MLRGVVLLTCNDYDLLRSIVLGNAQLGMLARLANFPDETRLCPTNQPGTIQRRGAPASRRACDPGAPAVIKQAPSFGRILTMVAFALSCFGILLFLWLSFGGSVPLRPEGYRVNVSFPEATQLSKEAEVRISGVKVGKVRKVEPNEETGLTATVLELESRYAPIPSDTRAILRQKTLLGETYVELTPGLARRRQRGAGRGRPGAGERLRDGGARRDPAHVRSGDAPEVLDLARPAGPGGGPRGAVHQRLARPPHAVRRGDRRRARRAEQPEPGHAPPGARRWRRVRRAHRARRSAARADRAVEPLLGGDRAPRRRAGRHIPGAADLPAREPRDNRARHAVRARTPIR